MASLHLKPNIFTRDRLWESLRHSCFWKGNLIPTSNKRQSDNYLFKVFSQFPGAEGVSALQEAYPIQLPPLKIKMWLLRNTTRPEINTSAANILDETWSSRSDAIQGNHIIYMVLSLRRQLSFFFAKYKV